MSAIKLEFVTKTYTTGEESAVKNVSLEIEEGSIVTLLGPSGCGKTTMLRIIAGFERPDSGVVMIGGKTVSDNNIFIPPERRGVGMVFQDYALFPHLNVLKNIGFGYKNKDKQEKVNSVLSLVGLNGYEKRYPHELSGGQQQRVALARALASNPLVVLLDEPFSNLDADLRNQMRLEVKNIIKAANATAVFVSHDQMDALSISDKIVVMNKGTIKQYGTPREIYQKPENEFVANFVGKTNIIQGEIMGDCLSVNTEIGILPIRSNNCILPGQKILVSIRPDSFELDKTGHIKGRIKSATYIGTSIDTKVEIKLPNGKTIDLLTHIHPEENISTGDLISIKILPEFVSIITPED